MKLTVIIMSKVPRAGNVKTRLQPILTDAQCVSLSEAFLEDAINKTRNVADELIIAFSPESERDYFAKFANQNFTMVAQKGANLGDKMFNAFQFAFANDSDAVVMIGTDSPSFPAEFMSLAFKNLQSSDVVLGESEDGGFYLIGLRILRREIFEAVEWSSENVFEKTVENIRKLNLKISCVPSWFDVDLPENLYRLKKELNKAGNIAPKTSRWLRENTF